MKRDIVPSVQDLLMPIVRNLSGARGDKRYGRLRQELASEWEIALPNIDKTFGATHSFADAFRYACEHLIQHGLVTRRKKWLSVSSQCRRAVKQDMLDAGRIPSYEGDIPVCRRKQRIDPQPPRHFDPSLSVPKIISKLPSTEFEKIAQIWKSAIIFLGETSKSKWHDDAHLLLEAISSEWERRYWSSDDEWFKWPTTEAPMGDGGLDLNDAPDNGMLSFLGYRVGRTNGQPSHVRRVMLDSIFKSVLPPVHSKTYTHSWGDKQSPARLKKIADVIASLARDFKRRNDDRFDDAIREWEDDLGYLHDKYYIGKFRFAGFAWPLA